MELRKYNKVFNIDLDESEILLIKNAILEYSTEYPNNNKIFLLYKDFEELIERYLN